jgi:hypothetical protein
MTLTISSHDGRILISCDNVGTYRNVRLALINYAEQYPSGSFDSGINLAIIDAEDI